MLDVAGQVAGFVDQPDEVGADHPHGRIGNGQVHLFGQVIAMVVSLASVASKAMSPSKLPPPTAGADDSCQPESCHARRFGGLAVDRVGAGFVGIDVLKSGIELLQAG